MSYYTIPEIFEQLEATSSKLEKLEILKREVNNDLFKMVAHAALNPFIVYHIKKIPEYKKHQYGGSLQAALKQLHYLSERKITGNKAIEFLHARLDSLSAADANILERVIKKKLDCGVSAKTINKVWSNLIPTYPCLLCSIADEKSLAKIIYPAYCQEKEDGMRVNLIAGANGDVNVRSRNGKLLEIFGKLDADVLKLSKGQQLVFDGELRCVEEDGTYMTRKKSNGILNKAVKGTITEEDASKIHAILWDVIPLDDFKNKECSLLYKERYDWLVRRVIESDISYKINLVRSVEVDSFYEAKKMFTNITSQGGEGVIIKNFNSLWEDKRSAGQVKLKNEFTADLVIKDIIEGSGKFQGTLGSFICESSDGLLEVSVGSGLSDEQRDEYYTKSMIGKVVELKYNEIIDSKTSDTKSLFLPIFVQVRDDKDEANSLDELK